MVDCAPPSGSLEKTAELIVATELQGRIFSGARQLAGKYLTFILQRESYGIDVLKVREIIRLTGITAVPPDARLCSRRYQPPGQDHTRD